MCLIPFLASAFWRTQASINTLEKSRHRKKKFTAHFKTVCGEKQMGNQESENEEWMFIWRKKDDDKIVLTTPVIKSFPGTSREKLDPLV